MRNLFWIGIVFFSIVSCSSLRLEQTIPALAVELSNAPGDTNLQALITPYRNEMKFKMDSVIGQSAFLLEKKRPESNLGNFVADLTFQYGYHDLKDDNLIEDNSQVFSLLNTGGLRSVVSEGNITIGDCFTLMPFNNEIVILKISGDKVSEIITYLEKSGGEPVGNIRLAYTKYSNTNKKIACQIGQQDFNPKKSYYVVTSDYLAKGGDNMSFREKPLEYIKTGKLLRDAIIEKVKSSKQKLEPVADGRIKFIKDE